MCLAVSAQTIDHEQRYNLLVSKFGPGGVGVETVLNNWAKVDSTTVKLLAARFDYYFTKAATTQVVAKPGNKYLGMKPVLTLKDSTGADVCYYQEQVFDDEIYGKALRAVDKAINTHPYMLEFRFMKANAYIAYEKESPDMALAYLIALAVEDSSRKSPWKYDGKEVDPGFVTDAMKDYCYSFYSIGSQKSLDAFMKLSEKMNELHPGNLDYLNNIGTYYLVAANDYKTALKYYGKVLKKRPSDYTAIKNSVIAARKMKNTKQEKKYLQMIVKYGPDNEKTQAELRLKAL